MPIKKENRGRYPADWRRRRKFVVKVRARDRCEWCGAHDRMPHHITGSKVVLTTAHIFDHRPEAGGLLNLAALCQRCHLGHDREDRRREKLRDLFGCDDVDRLLRAITAHLALLRMRESRYFAMEWGSKDARRRRAHRRARWVFTIQIREQKRLACRLAKLARVGHIMDLDGRYLPGASPGER